MTCFNLSHTSPFHVVHNITQMSKQCHLVFSVNQRFFVNLAFDSQYSFSPRWHKFQVRTRESAERMPLKHSSFPCLTRGSYRMTCSWLGNYWLVSLWGSSLLPINRHPAGSFLLFTFEFSNWTHARFLSWNFWYVFLGVERNMGPLIYWRENLGGMC